MARSRPADLARSFDSLVDPIYVVDRARRIVYANAACLAWTSATTEELLGRELHYGQVAGDSTSAKPDALCPPPLAFAGRRTSGELVPQGGVVRRAEFIPLGVDADGAALVLVWLPSAETATMLEEEHRRLEDESQRLHALTARLRRDAAANYSPSRLLGISPAMERVRKQIAVAAATSTTASHVTTLHVTTSIVGPPGVGKSRVAATIHALRTSTPGGVHVGPLVTLDGPTLDAEQLQAAIRSLARSAREEPRRTGDLVLQNVDRMPHDACAELAGFLKLVDLPMRILVTSSESLVRLAAAGKFPAELAARLSTLEIELPPLAARIEDLPVLAQHFIEEANASSPIRQLGGLTPEALDRLTGYAWPGNVAELAEVVAEACRNAAGPLVAASDLPRRLQYAADAARFDSQSDKSISLDDVLADVERELLQQALQRARGNKTKAASLLGLNRARLLRRLEQLGLESPTIVFEEVADDPTQGAAEKEGTADERG